MPERRPVTPRELRISVPRTLNIDVSIRTEGTPRRKFLGTEKQVERARQGFANWTDKQRQRGHRITS